MAWISVVCACISVVCGDCSGKDGAESWRMKTMPFSQTAAFLMQWDGHWACPMIWWRWRVMYCRKMEGGVRAGWCSCGGGVGVVHAVLWLSICKEKKKAFLEWSRNLAAWEGRYYLKNFLLGGENWLGFCVFRKMASVSHCPFLQREDGGHFSEGSWMAFSRLRWKELQGLESYNPGFEGHLCYLKINLLENYAYF